MKKPFTWVVYIAPNSGEILHAQARIYTRLFTTIQRDKMTVQIRDCYNAQPEGWCECGLVNYEGKLVCFEGPFEVLNELKASQPLMAGAYLRYECDTPSAPDYVQFARLQGPLAHLQNIPKEK